MALINQYADLNLNRQQIQDVRLHNIASKATDLASPYLAGQIYIDVNIGGKHVWYNDGGAGGPAGDGFIPVPRLDMQETVTALWSFDRGTSAPFGVINASAAKVDNLDADKLDGNHASASANANTIALRDAGGRLRVADPVDPDHVVNYQFMQDYVSGVTSQKEACRVATAAALPANTRTGNVLTASANGSINNTGIDGLTDLALNQRVLVKDEGNGAHNGIYYISQLGDASNPWTLTRALDADVDAEVVSGMQVWVTNGTANSGSGWLLTTPNPITLNTTSLTFVQNNGAANIDAGDGLTKSGNTLSVGTASASRIIVSADTIDLALSGVTAGTYGSASQVASITVDAYGRITAANAANISIAASQVTSGTLPVNRGGTGASTLTGILQGNGTSAVTAILGTSGKLAKWNSSNPNLADSLLADDGTTITASGNFNPNVTNTRSIGSDSLQWLTTNTRNVVLNAADSTAEVRFESAAASTQLQAAMIQWRTQADTNPNAKYQLILRGNSHANSQQLAWNWTPDAVSFYEILKFDPNDLLRIGGSNVNIGLRATPSATFPVTTVNVGPEADNTSNIGSATYRYANIYGTTFHGSFTPTGMTNGSVLFVDGGKIAQDFTNFRWDNTYKRLGIGTNAPASALVIRSTDGVMIDARRSNAGNVGMEFGSTDATGGDAFIDIHVASGVDYHSRLIRKAGVNGSLELVNSGSGELLLNSTTGNVRVAINDDGTQNFQVGPGTSGGKTFVFTPGKATTLAGGSAQASVISTKGVSSSSFHVGIEIPSNDGNDGFYVATDSNQDGTVDRLALKINASASFAFGPISNPATLQRKMVLAPGYDLHVEMEAPSGLAVTSAAGGSLVADTTYYWVVTAVGETGETVQSNQVVLTTTTANKTAALTWNAVRGAVSYKVFRSTISGDFTNKFVTTVTTNSYTDTGGSISTGTPSATTTGYVYKLDPNEHFVFNIGNILPGTQKIQDLGDDNRRWNRVFSSIVDLKTTSVQSMAALDFSTDAANANTNPLAIRWLTDRNNTNPYWMMAMRGPSYTTPREWFLSYYDGSTWKSFINAAPTWNQMGLGAGGAKIGLRTNNFSAGWSITTDGTIGPFTDNVDDIGSSSLKHRAIYAHNFYGNIRPTGLANGSVLFMDGNIVSGDVNSFFWDATNKRLGIGTNAPERGIHVKDDGLESIAILERTSADENGAALVFRKSRSGGAVQVGDQIARLNAAGSQGSDVFADTGAGRDFLQVLATQIHTSTAHGSELKLRTTPNGSTGAVDRIHITHDGKIGFGITNPFYQYVFSETVSTGSNSDPTAQVIVITNQASDQGTWAPHAIEAQARNDGTGPISNNLSGLIGVAKQNGSGTISKARGVSGSIQNSHTTGSITDAGSIWASSPYFTSTGGISKLAGLWVQNQGHANIGSAYGIYIETQSGASNNWTIYSPSSTWSYLAGSLGLGTSTPNRKLTISDNSFILAHFKSTRSDANRADIAFTPYGASADEEVFIGSDAGTFRVATGSVSTHKWSVSPTGIITHSGDTLPNNDNSHDLGAIGKRWAEIWGTNIYGNIRPTGLANGSVLFMASNIVSGDNSNFSWDSTNKRLGIGTSAPEYQIHIKNPASASIMIEADTDGVTESDNPTLWLSQDNRAIMGRFGVAGDAESNFTGARSNYVYIEARQASTPVNGIQFATGGTVDGVTPGTARLSISHTGDITVHNLTASKAVFTDASKNLTSTGTLGRDQGGTGIATSRAIGDLLYGNSSGNWSVLAANANTYRFLITDGSNGVNWSGYSMPNSMAAQGILYGTSPTTVGYLSSQANRVMTTDGSSNIGWRNSLPSGITLNGKAIARIFTQDIGNGSATVFNITHGFATENVVVQVFRKAGNKDMVLPDTKVNDSNTVCVDFGIYVPTANEFSVRVVG